MKMPYNVILMSIVFLFGVNSASWGINSHWASVAYASDIYVINSSDLKAIAKDDRIRNRYHYYTLPVYETLKGMEVDTLKLDIYLNREFIDYVTLLPDATKLIIFINNHYERYRNSGQDEFSNIIVHSNGYEYDKGIVVYTDTAYNKTIAEIWNQQLILQNRLYENFQKNGVLDDTIKRLFDRLMDREMTQGIFDEIITMGEEVIPYIILNMDDYRKLPVNHISIVNDSPDAWEGLAHYGPRLVIDIAALMLAELTRGYNFGYIYSGYSIDAERRRALDGWRIYLYYINHGLPTFYHE
jgi:hypothetical protein